MNSGRSAGISPYDGNGAIIYFSLIGNFLSIFWNKKHRSESLHKIRDGYRALDGEILTMHFHALNFL
jgi:hypothetical protein